MAQVIATSWEPPAALPRGLHGLAVLTAAVAVGLIAMGAAVTSTGSGDAVPDWPLSYGTLWPRMAGGVLFEHGHRLVAGLTALFIIALTIGLQVSAGPRWLKRLGWLACVAVLLQAVMGGLRVLVISDPGVQEATLAVTGASHAEPVRVGFAIVHATLAQIVLCLTFALALFTSSRWMAAGAAPAAATTRSLRSAALVLVGMLFFQLILGAVMRHIGAGRAIPDFPLSFGHLVPPLGDLPYQPHAALALSYGELQTRVVVHFTHRALGILMGVALFSIWWQVGRLTQGREPLATASSPAVRLANLLLVLVVIQVILGAMAVWTDLSAIVTIAHVATGAVLLGLSVLFALWTGRGWEAEIMSQARPS